MSAFLSFRYIPNADVQFADGIVHKEFCSPAKQDELIMCKNADDIEDTIARQLEGIDYSKTAILLSGGIDSGILASFMPRGTVAYTANAPTKVADIEIERARKVCDKFGLEHRVIDVTWEGYLECMDELMLHDGCPIFANEPQVYILACRILDDGFDNVIFGDNADMAFGGYDRLLSKDWTFTEWVNRFTFVDPKRVLKCPKSVIDVYERYRSGEDSIDYLEFMNTVFATSSSGAYINAFDLAGLNYLDPYAKMKMSEPFDLKRIRSGESKYLLRELYKRRIPEFDIPEKIAMARAVDVWLDSWSGPERDEFLPGCINGLTGEQKFLIYALERFLNIINQ